VTKQSHTDAPIETAFKHKQLINVYQNVEAVESYVENIRYHEKELRSVADVTLGLMNLTGVGPLRVLDIGIGDGAFTVPILDYLVREKGIPAQLDCLDVSEYMINKLQARLSEPVSRGYPVRYEKKDAEEGLPYERNAYDLVIITFVLHYINDYPKLIDHVLQCLKAGGLFLQAEVIGDMEFVDGNFKNEASPGATGNFKHFWEHYFSQRSQFSVWDPAISVTNMSQVFEYCRRRSFHSCCDSKEYLWPQKVTWAQLCNWIESGTVSSLGSDLRPDVRKSLSEEMMQWLSNHGIDPQESVEMRWGIRAKWLERPVDYTLITTTLWENFNEFVSKVTVPSPEGQGQLPIIPGGVISDEGPHLREYSKRLIFDVLKPSIGERCGFLEILFWDPFREASTDNYARSGVGINHIPQAIQAYEESIKTANVSLSSIIYRDLKKQPLRIDIGSDGSITTYPALQELMDQLRPEARDDLKKVIEIHSSLRQPGDERIIHIYYIPTVFNPDPNREIGIGGVAMITQIEYPLPVLVQVKTLLESALSKVGVRYLLARASEHARRSAIAAIMARNMSHNVGSHVLASPELLKSATEQEIQKLHNFLQQRMDFIAQVVTYTPPWGEPTFFFKDLLKGFFDQYLLLNYLIKDQGYDGRKLEFIIHNTDGVDCVYTYPANSMDRETNGRQTGTNTSSDKRQQARSWQLDRSEAEPSTPDDFLVSIPGGPIGSHAFYDIIENIMRNSAKYGNSEDTYQFHIRVTEESERYCITVWDNLSSQGDCTVETDTSCVCRVCKLRRSLSEVLISPDTGEVVAQSRGVHEMEECARILTHPHQDWRFVMSGKDYPLKAESVNDDNKQYLGFNFYLQKPRLVGIIHPEEAANSRAKQAGVFHYSTVAELVSYTQQFCVIFLPEKGEKRDLIIREVVQNRYLLPYRLLLVSDEAISDEQLQKMGLPSGRAKWCLTKELNFLMQNGEAQPNRWQQAILELYAVWLRKFKPTDNGKWHLMIGFDRDADHSAFERWRDGIGKFNSNIVDIVLVKARPKYPLEVVQPSDKTPDALSEQIQADYQRWLVFDNHGASMGTPEMENVERSKLGFYHETGENQLRIFQALESPPPPGFGFNYFVMGLLESAVTEVVVVDERVAEATFSDKPKVGDVIPEGFTKLLYELEEARCYPMFSVWTSDRKRTLISDALEKRDKLFREDPELQGEVIPLNENEGIVLMPGQPGPRIRFQKIHKTLLKDIVTADFVVIHQGVIDRLQYRGYWQETASLDALFCIAPSVVITSGRGRTLRQVPQTMPFLEFSIVRETTYSGMSKYHLVRALMSVSGRVRGGKQDG
jgi:ubiquinone/menaquinone biosynthesis C-methylase UbiE